VTTGPDAESGVVPGRGGKRQPPVWVDPGPRQIGIEDRGRRFVGLDEAAREIDDNDALVEHLENGTLNPVGVKEIGGLSSLQPDRVETDHPGPLGVLRNLSPTHRVDPIDEAPPDWTCSYLSVSALLANT
jgi:hypothetical protein